MDIRFKAYDTSKCDIECADGEIAIAYALGENTDGTYGAGIGKEVITAIPDGYTAITMHETPTGKNLIAATASDQTTLLHWCRYTRQAEIAAEDMQYIGFTNSIKCSCCSGEKVVIGTDNGLILLFWIGNGYNILLPDVKMPVIDFGLQKTGQLICNDTIVTDSEVIEQNTETGTGSGASRPHATPTSSEAKTKLDNIGQSIHDSFQRAVVAQATSKGYFTQPFMLRYGLRLHDGTYLMHSSPILMTPTTLPPIIGLTVREGQNGKSNIDIDLSENRYYELRYRLNQPIDEQLYSIIAGIDVYISRPIATYDTEKIKDGYLCTYAELINAMCNRHHNRREGENAPCFAGHYSEANDQYTDHITVGSAQSVWYTAPNQHMLEEMIEQKDMYLIASISIDRLMQSCTFTPLDIISSEIPATTRIPLLEAKDIQLQNKFRNIIPSAITTYGSQVVIASDYQKPIAPLPLEAMTPYSGDEASEVTDTQITVYSRHQGMTHKATTRSRSRRAQLTTGLPRYIYHHDPDAFMIEIRQNGHTWSLPLSKSADAQGAYWQQGLDTGQAEESSQQMQEATDALINTHTKIFTTEIEQPFKAKYAMNIGDNSVVTFATAMQAPQAGRFGQYPLYAFTQRGIMMLQYSDGTFNAAHQISTDTCDNANAVTTIGNKVAYATGNTVKLIEGTKITIMAPNKPFEISKLPHYQELLKNTTYQPRPFTYPGCMLMCDTDTGTLILSNGTTLTKYNSADGWCQTDLGIMGKITDGNREIAIDAENNIIKIAENGADTEGILVTRPMKLTKPIAANDVTRVEVLGDFKSDHVATAMYGANRLDKWHLIGTSRNEAIDDYNCRQYRYILVVVIARLEHGEYVYGIKVTS